MALTHSEILFARDLDEQLQKIHDTDSNIYIHNDLNNFKNNKMKLNNLNNRPQFITTVKKGSFLQPPPEVAALLGLGSNKSSATSPYSGSSASTATNGTQQETTTVVMYSYSSKPKVLHKNYHTDCSRNRSNNNTRDSNGPYGNLMYDRRIIRGSTYATNNTPMEDSQARQKEARRRAQARRKARVYSSRGRQGTPPPVPGRKHEPVQTERFLEELLDRPLENDVSCQTDLYIERPQSPLYMSSAGGDDKETQIYPGELFDFDMEIAPILGTLVTNSLEQSLAEVLEEEELLDIQVQQRRLQEIRALEEFQQKRLSGSEISLIKGTREEEFSEYVPRMADLLPAILEKLIQEGLSPLQDIDVFWLLDLIEARLSNPDVLEEFLKESLRSIGRLDNINSPHIEEVQTVPKDELLSISVASPEMQSSRSGEDNTSEVSLEY